MVHEAEIVLCWEKFIMIHNINDVVESDFVIWVKVCKNENNFDTALCYILIYAYVRVDHYIRLKKQNKAKRKTKTGILER